MDPSPMGFEKAKESPDHGGGVPTRGGRCPQERKTELDLACFGFTFERSDLTEAFFRGGNVEFRAT